MKKSKKAITSPRRESLVLVRNCVIVLALIGLVIGAVALPSSDFFLRAVPAVTVGNVTLSAKDFGACYRNTYDWYKLELTEKTGDSSTLPAFGDLAKSVRDKGTGETYAAFFRRLTIEKIAELDALYGTGFTTDMVPGAVDKYAEEKKDSLQVTGEQLAAYMAENTDMCDRFTYRYITLKPGSGDTDTVETARALAKDIAGRVRSETDFIAEARAWDKEKYAADNATLSSDSGDLLNPYYRDFLRDTARQYGDTVTVDMPTGAYVVYFVSRERDTETAKARLCDSTFKEWLAGAKPAARVRWGMTFSC
jgi:hypothetical protein